jgi:hypothetical protein
MKQVNYSLENGVTTITAVTPEEFVTKLREGSKFDSECTDEEYMDAFAKRYALQTGNRIRAGSPSEFLSELRKYGYVKEIEG